VRAFFWPTAPTAWPSESRGGELQPESSALTSSAHRRDRPRKATTVSAATHSCDNPGPLRDDYVFYVHIPKTGTSFATVLIHSVNASLDPWDRVSTCDDYCMEHDCAEDSTKDRKLRPYKPHACTGALDGLFNRLPYATWFRGSFVDVKNCDAAAHVPIDDELWEAHHGHFQGLFRDPLDLAPSQYLRSNNGIGKTPDPYHLLRNDFSMEVGATALREYARDYKGQMVRFLTGALKPQDDTRDMSMGRAKEAVERLKGFSFVGITDEWETTVCLYHRMIMDDAPCLPVEFVNNRETETGNTTLGRRVLEEAGWLDDFDMHLWGQVQRLFRSNVAKYDVTWETCAAIGCTKQAAHSAAREDPSSPNSIGHWNRMRRSSGPNQKRESQWKDQKREPQWKDQKKREPQWKDQKREPQYNLSAE